MLKRLSCLILLALLALLVLLPQPAALGRGPAAGPEPLAVVVSRRSPVFNLTLAELSKVFRGERPRDPDGNRYAVIMREPASPERGAVLAQVYRMTDAEYKKYFLQATFTGAVQVAPRQVGSAAAVRQAVADSPGAIGYLRLSDADDTVRVIQIDGKAPSDPDYPLKVR